VEWVWKQKHRFLIGNLDKYIKMFSDCLVHLINYEVGVVGVDFSDYGVPVVISRCTHIRASINSKYQRVILVPAEDSHLDLKLNVSRLVSDTYKSVERRSNYNLHCRAQFYIVTDKFKFGEGSFTIPYAFKSFWMG